MTSLIELLGPAGSGKSTVAAELARRPEVAIVRDVGAVPPAARAAAAVTSIPRALRVAAVRGAARPFGWTARVDAFRAVRSERPVLVLDQGPVYTLARLLSARPSTADDRWFRRRAQDWGERLRAVVVLDAPDELLVDRIVHRQKEHVVRHLSVREALISVRQQRSELERMVVELERYGTEVFDLSTADTTADRVADTVASVWAPIGAEERR